MLDLTLGLSKEQAQHWITTTLLPALNRQNGPRGVDMLPALRDLCKVRYLHQFIARENAAVGCDVFSIL